MVHELKPEKESRSVRQIVTEIIIGILLVIVAVTGFTLFYLLFG
jgi:hypothetical protein